MFLLNTFINCTSIASLLVRPVHIFLSDYNMQDFYYRMMNDCKVVYLASGNEPIDKKDLCIKLLKDEYRNVLPKFFNNLLFRVKSFKISCYCRKVIFKLDHKKLPEFHKYFYILIINRTKTRIKIIEFDCASTTELNKIDILLYFRTITGYNLYDRSKRLLDEKEYRSIIINRIK